MDQSARQIIRKESVGAQLAGLLRGEILAGRLRPGDALPSERALAARHDINRSSVREALQRLEAWGLVEIRQGGPTRVVDVFRRGAWQMLPHLLRAPGGGELLADVLALRVMFLAWTAAQAARRHGGGPLPDLRALVARMGETDAVAEVLRLDWRFFEALVAMTGNRVLRLSVSWLREVYLEDPEPVHGLYQPLPFDVSLHARAVDALEAGDPEGARAAMEAFALRPLGGAYLDGPPAAGAVPPENNDSAPAAGAGPPENDESALAPPRNHER